MKHVAAENFINVLCLRWYIADHTFSLFRALCDTDRSRQERSAKSTEVTSNQLCDTARSHPDGALQSGPEMLRARSARPFANWPWASGQLVSLAWLGGVLGIGDGTIMERPCSSGVAMLTDDTRLANFHAAVRRARRAKPSVSIAPHW